MNRGGNLALFCDFENIALGVRDAKYAKFDIQPVLERLLLKGSIVTKKVYCDWERYKDFKPVMHKAAFELIEIPPVRLSGKNSADIRMAVDSLDLVATGDAEKKRSQLKRTIRPRKRSIWCSNWRWMSARVATSCAASSPGLPRELLDRLLDVSSAGFRYPALIIGCVRAHLYSREKYPRPSRWRIQ
jgi:NYN domain